MNDRFKFRGFHPVLAEVQEIKFIDFIHNTVDFGNGDIFDIEEVKLQQCTGLKDKNSKLIYEGDIVKDISLNWILKVGYKKCAFYIKNKVYTGYFHELAIAYSEKRLEVIGNIYENKELLEEECQK